MNMCPFIVQKISCLLWVTEEKLTDYEGYPPLILAVFYQEIERFSFVVHTLTTRWLTLIVCYILGSSW